MYKIISPDREQTFDSEYTPYSNKVVQIFLAGSIEMGKAKKWHEDVAAQIYNELKAKANGKPMSSIVFYNPRRVDGFTKELEEEQIEWEQFRILHSDYIFMYIQSDTKSPISLLEFGENVSTGKLFTCCGKEFYKYANLEVTARQFNAPLFNTIDDGVNALVKKIVE